MTEIIKRDGSRQPYAPEKIVEAMKKSFRMREEPADPEELQRLLESVEKRMAAVTGDWHVEDIQDAVERALMERGHYDAAKRYILYRQRRTEFRAARTSLTEGTGAPELEGTLMKIQRDFPQERYPLTALCAKAVGFIKPGMETGAALDALVKHHDALRLNLDEDGRLFYNSLHRRAKIIVEEAKIHSLEEIQSIQTSFHLSKDLLLRGRLLRMRQERYLFLTLHHLVVDGVSWRILLDDLALLLSQQRP